MRFFIRFAALAAFALPLGAAAGSYTISTLAGLPGGPGFANGAGPAARFNGPTGAAVDSAGNIYIADTGNNAIREVTPAGVVTTLAGTGQAGNLDGPGTSAIFNGPGAIAIDGAGNLYVADSQNGSVRKIVVSGGVATVSTVLSIGGVLGGIAVDAAGDAIYVSSQSLNLIYFINLSGGAVTTWGVLAGDGNPSLTDGPGASAEFNAPAGLLLANPTLLYVADQGNDAIRAVTITSGPVPQASVSTVAGSGTSGYSDGTGWTGETAGTAVFNGPQSLVQDGSGNLYVSDTGNDVLREIINPMSGNPPSVVTAVGTASAAADVDGPVATARFNSPEGLAYDTLGNAYVVDTATGSLRKILGGVVSTLAGGSGPGADDGTGSAARIGSPCGTAVDGHGNVYVADSTNNTIRMISPGGAVTTIAGSPGLAGFQDGVGAGAQFNGPIAIAVDAAGDTAYVADPGNFAVRKLTISGGVATVTTTTYAGRGHVPYGVALDAAGDVFVTDIYFQCVNEITSGGNVITLAGYPYNSGAEDGVGLAARFYFPIGIACNPAGTVLYVADQGNYAIRKITVAGGVGTVSTAAGHLGIQGYGDGPAASSYVGAAWGVAMDSSGNVYFTEAFLQLIRELDTTNTVSTLAGTLGGRGFANGTGGAAEFDIPLGIAVDSGQNLYIGDNSNFAIRKGAPANPAVAPALQTQPQSQSVGAGGIVVFSVTATGTPAPTYQWEFNGAPIAGATGSSYELSPVELANAGSYSVVVTNTQGSVTSAGATLTVYVTPQVVTPPQNVTVNAGGSAAFSVVCTGVPAVTYQWYFNGLPIANATTATLALNDVTQAQAGTYTVQASNLGGAASASAKLVVNAPAPLITSPNQIVGTVGQSLTYSTVASNAPTAYSASGTLPPGTGISSSTGVITGVPTQSGVYTVTLAASNAGGTGTLKLTIVIGPAARPMNFSLRAVAGPGSHTLVAGFEIAGLGSEQTLIRAVGPTLAAYGIAGSLPDPALVVFNSASAIVDANTGWGNSPALSAAFTAVGAFALLPNSNDDAVLDSYPVGGYTAQVTSTSGDNGIVLLEFYDADTGSSTAHLANVSGLANVGTGTAVVVAGFAIGGSSPEPVLLRAVGPTLGGLGLAGALGAPTLTLADSTGATIATNSGWTVAPAVGNSLVAAIVQPASASVMNAAGAFPLEAGSHDCAMVVTLPPGTYTATVAGAGNSTGLALVELYNLAP